MSVYKNVGNIFNYNCVDCEYNRHCYGGNLGNQYRFCQKSREKLEDFDKLQQENQKYKEVIDKLSKTIYEIDELRKTTGGYPSSYMDNLLDILKEVK